MALLTTLGLKKSALIPHYTIRYFDQPADSLIISFRILRKPENEEVIKSLVEKFMKGYRYEIDPKEGSCFSKYHAWENLVHWTRDKCEKS
jgi:hypothetical protein